MRSEQDMMRLIRKIAEDSRIRAVVMNGSRANPNLPKDRFQDYDIVYVVRNIASFTKNHTWIDAFGKRIMLQMPEEMRDPLNNGTFSYLMLFDDGNRIDLTLIPIEDFVNDFPKDSQSILLLDKDGLTEVYPPANDSDYYIKKPSEHYYSSCCNNFWWCTQNVAKGIFRNELPYTMLMYHRVLRSELHDMIDWYIGSKTNFKVSSGKFGKYYKLYLSEDEYNTYTDTYTDSDPEHIWDALFSMCGLFRTLAVEVATFFGYSYPENDDEQMTAYLKHVRSL